jgi:hypothetical protein
MSPPIDIDGTEIQEATIDGQDVSEITIDGQQAAELNVLPVSDIANFESGSLDPSFNGATGDYEVSSTSPTLTGVFSLKSTVSGPGSISSESGFDNYPQQGQRFACYVYMGSTKSTSNGLGIGWASQDPDNMFVVTISEKGGEMEVFELNNGAFSNLASQSVSLNRFDWYDIEVEWTTSGGITARVFDVDQTTGDRLGSALAEVTTTSTSYTSGGVGFIGFGSGTRSRFDNYRILEEF